MNPKLLNQVIQLVAGAITEMNKKYTGIVFDEFLLIKALNEKISLIHYDGPRNIQEVKKSFKDDFRDIKAQVLGEAFVVGEFHFANEAEDTVFDAFVYIGQGTFVVFNHTKLSMTKIKQQGDWIQAQEVFLELAEALRSKVKER